MQCMEEGDRFHKDSLHDLCGMSSDYLWMTVFGFIQCFDVCQNFNLIDFTDFALMEHSVCSLIVFPSSESNSIFCKEKEDPYVIERHAKDSMHPIYMEGFNASPDAENPYIFNRELSQQRSIIAMKRHLTDEDKIELKKLQEQLKDEPWDRWSQGHFVRSKYVYLK